MTSKIKVNTVTTESGSTLTLGESGKTVTIASGATTSGMGRAGAVDWQTSIKTAASFTAANGEGYFIDTSSNAITATLPAGTAGSIVAFRDYANNFASNGLTIAANGSQKIENSTENFDINDSGESVTLVYADDTKGWLVVGDGNTDAGSTAGFIEATGGSVATVDTNFKVHTFTSPGTFCVSSGGGPQAVAGYLVVAGGGASPDTHSSGSGGGGYREGKSDPVTGPYTGSPIAATASIPYAPGAFPVTVGAGGAHSSGCCGGASGSNSILNYRGGSTITSAGGGKGKNGAAGVAGGSGGGGGASGGPTVNAGGAGNTPPVSPAQGFAGGTGGGGPGAGGDVAGGGGGATEAGVNGNTPATASGRGGAGTTTNITGSPVAYAGGGGGGGRPPNSTCNGAASPCGTGGAANAGDNAAQPTRNGLTNKGGGGAGGVSGGTCAGNGGSGVVVIRYKFQ